MAIIPSTFQKEKRFDANPRDLFITKYQLAYESCKVLRQYFNVLPRTVLDPGCGTGVWGKVARETWGEIGIVGVDIDPESSIMPHQYTYVYIGDYLEYKPSHFGYTYDLILGNPPFSSKTNRALAEDFVLHSLDLLSDTGTLAFFLKTEFVSAERRMENIFLVNPPIAMIQYVPRPQFNGYKFNNTIEYALFIWKKNNSNPTKIYWLNWKTGEFF